jgi:hypothetical protein
MGVTLVQGSRSVARHRRVGRAGQDESGYGRTGLLVAGQQEAVYPGNATRSDGSGYHSDGWDGRPAQENLFPVTGRAGRRRGATGWLRGYVGLMVSVTAVVVCGVAVGVDIHANHAVTARSAADSVAHAASSPKCTLIVPASPLATKSPVTPYQLTAMNPAAGPWWQCGSAATPTP